MLAITILALFFAIPIECYLYSLKRSISNQNRKMQTKTYFPEKDRNKSEYDMLPLYTLIWYDCDKCTQLLQEMEDLRLKNVYINGGEYFYDIEDAESKFNTPLLYKDEIFIGDNLFDIYAEIYREI